MTTTHHQRPANLKVVSPKVEPTPAAAAPAGPTTYSNADKARTDEQTNKANSYAAKTTTAGGQPIDAQERVALGGIVAQINDDIRAISGAGGGLQAPKTVGAGNGR
jgi:hypothetical protein